MTTTALDRASAIRAEQSIEAEIETIDEAATELLEHETPAPSTTGPQRIAEIEVPAGSYTIAGTGQFVFEPDPAAGVTRVLYSVRNRAEKQRTLDFVLRNPDGDQFKLSNRSGTQRLRLRLKTDSDDDRYVEMTALDDPDI